MKIEIELEEVAKLRDSVEFLKKENRELREKIDDATIKSYEQKAINLSQFLFHKYMEATLKYLGFELDPTYRAVGFNDVSHRLGKRWYDNDRMTVILSATITNKFRSAFLSYGVAAEKMPDQEDDNLLMEV